MSQVDACPEHIERTRRRELRYCFSIKHHGGSPKDAQWVEDLDHDAEFAIFDEADWHEVSDEGGHLYGLRRDEDQELLDLGTRGEQIAKFWMNKNRDQPWHGFPLWPLGEGGSENRKKRPIPKEALNRMMEAGLIDDPQRKRLLKGKTR